MVYFLHSESLPSRFMLLKIVCILFAFLLQGQSRQKLELVAKLKVVFEHTIVCFQALLSYKNIYISFHRFWMCCKSWWDHDFRQEYMQCCITIWAVWVNLKIFALGACQRCLMLSCQVAHWVLEQRCRLVRKVNKSFNVITFKKSFASCGRKEN